MMNSRQKVLERTLQYIERYGCVLEDELGFGFDGIVLSTNCQSAVKGFRYEKLYQRERDIYQRLQAEGITRIRDFKVPSLIRFDDEFWVVEMTVVSPPFVLDFAGAYLDQRPDYPEDVMESWREEKMEQFGDHWPEVQALMRAFAKLGIYLADVKPGNIEFAE